MAVIKRNLFKNHLLSHSALFVVFLLLHLAAQWLGNHFFFEPENVATLWPASGLLVAVLLTCRYQQWPVIIAAVFTSSYISDVVFFERSLLVYFMFTSAELAECILGAWLVRRTFRRRFDNQNFRQVIGLLLLAGFLATTLGAAIGATGVLIGYEDAHFWRVWKIWWFADALGIIVVTPLLLAISKLRLTNFQLFRHKQIVELAGLFILLFLTLKVIFGSAPISVDSQLGFAYIAFPLVIWGAVRFNPIVPALVTITIAFYSVWQADQGLGPFVVHGLNTDGLALSIQGFIAALAILSPLLSAAVRSAVENEVLINSFLKNSPHLLTIKDMEGRYTHVNQQFCTLFNVSERKALGRSPRELFSTKFTENIEQGEFSNKNLDQVWESEFKINTPVGEKIYKTVRFPVNSSDGETVAIGGIASDITDLRLQQDSLEQSERRHRQLFESAPVALFESDWTKGMALIAKLKEAGVTNVLEHLQRNPGLFRCRGDMGVLTNVNQEALRIYKANDKASLIDFIQNTPIETMPAGLIERMASHFSGIRRDTRDSVSQRCNGELFATVVTSEIISQIPDDWTQMLTMELDISAQRQAEAELKDREEKFRNLAEGSLQGIAVFDADWNIEYVNQALATMLGHIDTESVMRLGNWSCLIPPEEMSRMRQYRSNRLIGDAPKSQYETRLLKLDGGVIDVLAGVRLIEWNSKRAFQYLVFDITARKQAENALLESESRYRRLFEAAPVALWEWDWSRLKSLIDELKAQGIINICQHLKNNPQLVGTRSQMSAAIDVNAETLRMHGAKDRAELLEMKKDELWLERGSGMLERISGLLNGQRRVVVEGVGTKMNGKEFPIRITTEIVGDNLDDWSKVFAADQDISEEVQATARLNAYQDQLRSLAGQMSLVEESERRRIASNLHDGTVQNLVLARMKLSGLKKSLRSEKSIEAADIINELLEQSLKEARTMIFDLSPPVLYELGLASAIEWLCGEFKLRTKLDVSFISDDQPAKLTHELKIVLFQAVRELLVNVVKHAKAKRVSITWVILNNEIELTVEDDGIGFDIADVGNKGSAEGGFGLFSLRERLKLLGANLVVESSKKGSTMRVRAPLIVA